jgi:hypothetical protein
MAYINKQSLLVLTTFALFFSGCFDDQQITFDGAQIEFEPTSASITQGEAASHSATIQLMGPQQDTDMEVIFEVDSEESTAVRGTHFEIPAGDQVTLDANSNSTAFEIEILDGLEPGDDSVEALIVLVGDSTNEVEPAENYKTFTLTILPQAEAD